MGFLLRNITITGLEIETTKMRPPEFTGKSGLITTRLYSSPRAVCTSDSLQRQSSPHDDLHALSSYLQPVEQAASQQTAVSLPTAWRF